VTEEKILYSPANVALVKTIVSHYVFSENEFAVKSNALTAKEIVLIENYKNWVRVIGLKDELLLQEIAAKFGIHALALEDILHTVQRPKIDEYESSLFVVLKMFYVKTDIKSQQISFFVKDNLLISFEEKNTNSFKGILDRLERGDGLIRKKGEDFLLYLLIDAIIDEYFITEEKIYSEVNKLEDIINLVPKKMHLTRLIKWRKEILLIKKSIAPLLDVIQTMGRINIVFFEKENKFFLRDLNDHLLRAIDNLDTHRESVYGLIEMYHSQLNTKMNEVMKTLTIMSSIFIPLTFIVGIYGMNFKYMPELEIHNGYFVTLAVMGAIAIGLLIYFKIKRYF
jgi:magnesium transporter